MTKMFAHAMICLLGLTAVTFRTPSAVADGPKKEYHHLVQQLGNPSFRVRETAARQLEQAGLAARAALLRGLKNPDLEVRMGAHRLLTQVLQQDFDRKLAEFLEDDKSSVAGQLPAWHRFRQSLGSGRKTRELFVKMLRRELPLLNVLAHNAQAGAVEQAAKQRLRELLNTRLPNGSRETIAPASIATLLFVTAQDDLKVDVLTESSVYRLLVQSTVKQQILAGPQSTALKKLLQKWIIHSCKGRHSYYAIQLTLTFNLSQLGAQLGREKLQDSTTIASILPYAAIALARFGQRDDVRFLLPQLRNKTVCHTWSNMQLKKEPIRIEVRDVILAMLIHISGQDPKDYGFKLLQPAPDTIYRIYTFGFLSDGARDKALKKWDIWYTAHGKSFRSPAKMKTGAAARQK